MTTFLPLILERTCPACPLSGRSGSSRDPGEAVFHTETLLFQRNFSEYNLLHLFPCK